MKLPDIENNPPLYSMLNRLKMQGRTGSVRRMLPATNDGGRPVCTADDADAAGIAGKRVEGIILFLDFLRFITFSTVKNCNRIRRFRKNGITHDSTVPGVEKAGKSAGVECAFRECLRLQILHSQSMGRLADRVKKGKGISRCMDSKMRPWNPFPLLLHGKGKGLDFRTAAACPGKGISADYPAKGRIQSIVVSDPFCLWILVDFAWKTGIKADRTAVSRGKGFSIYLDIRRKMQTQRIFQFQLHLLFWRKAVTGIVIRV